MNEHTNWIDEMVEKISVNMARLVIFARFAEAMRAAMEEEELER